MSKIKLSLPPVATLREVFSIDPNDGILTRRGATSREAGYLNNIGYRQVALCGRIYSVHRIAWALYYGEHPIGEVDHINGARSDNRLCNLRLATSSQNNQNRRLSSRNKTGVKGVFPVRQNKGCDRHWWRVAIGHDQGQYYITHFHCFGKAVKHAHEMRVKFHQEFASTGVAA